jgi:predicted permease
VHRIEVSPGVARALRSLSPPERHRISERIGHLEAGGLPPSPGADDPSGCVLVPAANHVLVCVPFLEGRAILIAALEPAAESAGQLAGRWLRSMARPWTGETDEAYAAAWPRSAGPWSLRFPRRGSLMVEWVRETRRAVRTVAREPGMAAMAVLALGLGIGLPTAMFGILDATLLRGLPVDSPRQILHLERRPEGARGEGWGAPVRDYVVWSAEQRSFEALAAYYSENVALRAGTQTERYNAARITPNAFTLLRARSALGRVFDSGDGVQQETPVMIGHHVWRDRFASDPGVIGQTVWIEGAPHTIVGVMPDRFRFPFREDLWLPLRLTEADIAREDTPSLMVFGRLRDGESLRSARAEYALIAARMVQTYPETRGWDIVVKRYTERFMGETATATMWVFFGAVLLVLIIACTNVANLLLVRAVYRVRDLAVRRALGAGRAPMVASLMLESGVLAVAGGVVGLLVALAATGAMSRLLSDRLPFWAELRMDARALAFVAIVTIAAALLAGVLPALRAMRPDVRTLLQDETRGSTGIRMGRIMQGLVVLQIALSLSLLVATGLLMRGIGKVRDVGLRFETERIFTAGVTLPASYDSVARAAFWTNLERRLETSAGAAVISLATAVPVTRAPSTRFAIEGQSYEDEQNLPAARRAIVSNTFFDTFSARAVRGRLFAAEDAAGAPVVIINERFAARFFPGEDPLGRRIRLGTADAGQPWRSIVGIVPDLWMAALDASGDRNPAGVYVPLAQASTNTITIAALSHGDARSITTPVRDAVFALDPDVPIHDVKTMPQVIEDNSWFFGMGASIMGACGIAALVLATIGLYGVVAFSVGRRTREIGIRIAIGADPPSIVRLMLRRGLLQIAAGLVLGLTLAFLLAQGIASLIFDVSPTDPIVFASVGLILVAIALVATLFPALRAARIHPLQALRTE